MFISKRNQFSFSLRGTELGSVTLKINNQQREVSEVTEPSSCASVLRSLTRPAAGTQATCPPLACRRGTVVTCSRAIYCLAVVTLPPSSTAPTVAGCRLVGCSVVSGRPLRSRAVAGMSQRVRVGLGPVLAFRAPSPPAAAWRGRGRVPIAGWSLGGVGPDRGLRGGGRGGWCEEWARIG